MDNGRRGMLADFEADLLLNGYSPKTARAYVETLGRFLLHSACAPSEIGAAHIKQWLRLLMVTPKKNGRHGENQHGDLRSASTIYAYLKAVKCWSRWAYENNRIPADIAKAILGPRPKDRIMDPTAPKDVIALLREARGRKGRAPVFTLRNHSLIMLAFDSGCRISELLSLNVGDVLDADGDPRESFRVMGKGGKERSVALAEAPARALLEYLALRNSISPERPLFTDQDGKRLTYIGARNALRRIRAAARLDVSWHDGRRTAYTELAKAGMDFNALMAEAGWSDPRTPRRYIHAAESVRAVAQHHKFAPSKQYVNKEDS